ncbi:MAG: hypothetical protein O2800_04065 [Planctomycetota bacterium]|nr:hypothetical protein [Planctomycetota bacterium]
MRRPSRALVVGILSTACAFAPSRFLAPWTNDLGSVVWIPFAPLGFTFSTVRVWLRPPIADLDLTSPVGRHLVSERDRYRGLWHSERIANDELRKRLESVSRARIDEPELTVALVTAPVIALDGSARNPLLRIGQGTNASIQVGDIVLYGGDALVGRISAPISGTSATVIPVWSPASGRMDARVIDPSGGPNVAVQVTVGADGVMRAELAQPIEVPNEIEVRLSDRAWPPGAQGMLLGVVKGSERADQRPLRKTLILEPAARRVGLDWVVVKTPVGRRPV